MKRSGCARPAPDGPKPMPHCRLLLVAIVLLQAGLAAARVHSHPGCDAPAALPHVHTCQLIDLFDAPGHDRDEESDHDADRIDLSDALAPAPPAAAPDPFAARR